MMIGAGSTYEFRMQAVLFALFVLHLCPVRAQQNKVFEYGVNQGLPESYVYALSQDPSGYLWIGTGEGLARFDGNSFAIFTRQDSLCDDFVTTIQSSDHGTWVGHLNGGISLYSQGKIQKVVAGDQGTGPVTDIKKQGQYILAATQYGGIWMIDKELHASQLKDTLNSISIFALAPLSSSECMIGSIDGAYLIALDHEGQGFSRIRPIEGIPETKIQDLTLSREGELVYILTQDEGLFIYAREGELLRTESFAQEMQIDMEGAQQVFEDADMNLWIPTYGNGLYKYDRKGNAGNGDWSQFKEDNGLPGNDVKCVLQDREQNIWLGMYGTGLTRLVSEAYVYYSFDNEEIGSSYHSIYADRDYYWFGAETGAIRIDRNSGKRMNMYGPGSGLPRDRITAFGGSPGGNLWMGSAKNGVYKWISDEDRFIPVGLSSGVLENSINALEEFGDSLLWVATERGVGKVNLSNGKVDWFTISRGGIPHNSVKDLWLDSVGRVWLSTLSTSASYIQDDSVIHIPIPHIESPVNISSVWVDPQEQIWLATQGSGVLKLAGDSVVNYSSDDGLLSNYCQSLMSDGEGKLWISHRSGLSRIRLSDEHISQVGQEVGIQQSMEFNPNASLIDAAGKLWYGSTQGVLSVDPRLEKTYFPPPALSLTAVSVNDQEMVPGSELRLRPGRYDLRIAFIGVHLKNPGDVTYRYMMEGIEETWSESSRDTHVLYNKIPDGRYTFQLISTSANGISNQVPLKYSIIIAKPVWKQWWFYIFALVSLALLVSGYVKRREHTLRMEKEALERAVHERTLEVVNQKVEIEKQNNAIIGQNEKINLINKNMTDSIAYAQRIQQALFPPQNSLSQLFPDSFLMIRPCQLVSGDFYWVAEKGGKRLITVADCTGHGVPGAFMSIMGINFLNDLINSREVLEANVIMNQLKSEIIRALRQRSEVDAAVDGMDMALCIYDPENSTMQYSGGFIHLVMVRDKELHVFKANSMPVGIGAVEGIDFILHEIEVRKGDVIYLFSDGYEDQFGGEKDKKFSRKRLRNMLLDIHGLPMPEQNYILEKTMEAWMDGREQIDDITVVGIRF